MRTQFTFYESFYKAISRIKKKADRADAYDIICAYALFQEEPNLDSVSDAVSIAFELLRPVLDKAREKAESGKSGGSKLKANGKQNGSKQEANCKQEEGESEKEKEKEGEIENECYPPTPFSQIIASYSFSDPLIAETIDWLKYKSERRETYKEQGLKSLLTQIQKNAAKYGEQAVIDLMEQCMAANWAGIIWDRLMKGGPANGKPDGNAQSERVGHYL